MMGKKFRTDKERSEKLETDTSDETEKDSAPDNASGEKDDSVVHSDLKKESPDKDTEKEEKKEGGGEEESDRDLNTGEVHRITNRDDHIVNKDE